MAYLLDTNVVSEPYKSSPDEGVAQWLAARPNDVLFVSAVTIGEIRRGIARLRLRNDHRQAAHYDSWLTTIKDSFQDRLVPVTVEIAEQWGEDDARRPLPTADGLIAGTAKVHGWTLVTRNTKDFEATGVRLLNPFSG
ncbi:MAG: type II toxin-antitoxin system VapC family toxin [Micromonosporaceae bacterium]